MHTYLASSMIEVRQLKTEIYCPSGQLDLKFFSCPQINHRFWAHPVCSGKHNISCKVAVEESNNDVGPVLK